MTTKEKKKEIWDWLCANEREKLRRRGFNVIETDLSNPDKSTLIIDLSKRKEL